MSFNGYKNWETWNVCLWAANDEDWYNYCRRHSGNYTATLAEEVTRELWPVGTPDMDSKAEYESVDWDEVAECYNAF